jgi:peptide-methionine (R)-S-oxide reductase
MSRFYAQLWVGVPAAAFFCLVCSLGARAQDPLANAPLAPGSAVSSDASDQNKPDSTTKSETKALAKPEPEFVVKTDAEWRKILTRTQYSVTRQKATEPAFSGKYATAHYQGTFLCVCCDAALFSAEAKFDSGTGWPSFDRPASMKSIKTAWDNSEIEPRVEVMCRRCGAHLGHVFDDGPTLTRLRYCVNSAALKLKPTDSHGALNTVSRETPSKSKAKAKQKSKSMQGSAPKGVAPPTSTSPADSEHAPKRDSVTSKGASSSPSS